VFSFFVVVSWWVSFLVFVPGGWGEGGVLEIDFAFQNGKMGAVNRGNIQ